MGCLCSTPPDLTEHHLKVADWEEIFGSGSIWIGKAKLHNQDTDYLEINVISRPDNPLQGRRVINIAEGKHSESTRFEFVIEPVPKGQRKSQDSPTHIVVFYWEDPSGLILRGTVLNEEKNKVEGQAVLNDTGRWGQTFKGDFHLIRAMAPSNTTRIISPRNPSSLSTHKLVVDATALANEKFESEEFQRISKIDAKSLRAAQLSSEKLPDSVLSNSPRNGGKTKPKAVHRKRDVNSPDVVEELCVSFI